MKKKLFFVIILFSCLKGFSQDSIRLYLNDNYMSIQKDSAKYMREVIRNKAHYYITDKYINGIIYNYYELSSLNPRIEDGLSIHYDEKNKIYSKGNYEQGTMKGQWLYYNDDNTIDTVYYSTLQDKNKRNKPESIYYTKSEKTKALGYLITDSLSCFIKENFHLPARARDEYKNFWLNIDCIIGSNGKVLWHEIETPQIHNDINKEISRIISLFHYEVKVKEPFELSTGFSYGLPTKSDDSIVYVIVEEMPEFQYKNYKNNFGQYVKDNLKHTFSNCNGRVYVNFVVEKDGQIGNMKIIKGIENCIGYVEEIERIFKTCPAWTPGKQRGKQVRVRCNVLVSFGND